jgi:hypothetical protein
MTSERSMPGSGRAAVLATSGELAPEGDTRGVAVPTSAISERSAPEHVASEPSSSSSSEQTVFAGPAPAKRAEHRPSPIEGHLDSSVVEELTRRLPTSELVKIIKGALECGRRNVPFTESDLLRTMTFGSSSVPARQPSRPRSPRS